MRILVTGASGNIGRPVVALLLAAGYEITALSAEPERPDPPDRPGLRERDERPDPPGRLDRPGLRERDERPDPSGRLDRPERPEAPGEDLPVREVVADATDETAVAAALTGCAAVVHLAALAHPSLGTPLQVYRGNVTATFTVLSCAARLGIRRAVIASSINATGINFNPHGVLPAYFPLDEDSPHDVADAYSLSKEADERTAAMAARAWGMTVVALRFPFVRTIPELREAAAAGDPTGEVRNGWAYLTSGDAARAVLASLVAPLTGAHVIGLSATDILLDRPTSELLDRYAPTVPRRRAFTGREALVDTSAAERLLGFRPQESVHR